MLAVLTTPQVLDQMDHPVLWPEMTRNGRSTKTKTKTARSLFLVNEMHKELLLRDHPHVDPVFVGEVRWDIQLKTLSIPKCRDLIDLGVGIKYFILWEAIHI